MLECIQQIVARFYVAGTRNISTRSPTLIPFIIVITIESLKRFLSVYVRVRSCYNLKLQPLVSYFHNFSNVSFQMKIECGTCSKSVPRLKSRLFRKFFKTKFESQMSRARFEIILSGKTVREKRFSIQLSYRF